MHPHAANPIFFWTVVYVARTLVLGYVLYKAYRFVRWLCHPDFRRFTLPRLRYRWIGKLYKYRLARRLFWMREAVRQARFKRHQEVNH
jgi:hypothetical protein